MSLLTGDLPAHVLVVDDDEGTAILQRRALQRAGYQVTIANDTPGALGAIEQFDPDLLVLDFSLEGGRSGLEFYRELRRQPGAAPAILVTGFVDEKRKKEALLAGFCAVVEKAGEYLDHLPVVVARVLAVERARWLPSEIGDATSSQAIPPGCKTIAFDGVVPL